jgi:hypothetical protein
MVQISKSTIVFGIIMFFIILYAIFLLMIHLMDYRLHIDKINGTNNTDNIIKNEETNILTTSDERHPNKVVQSTNLLTDSIETFSGMTDVIGVSNNENHIYGKYLENSEDNIVIDDGVINNSYSKVCCLNHNHDNYKCSYGATNFPNPNNLNAIDRKVFKSFYQANMTLQDYINWLYLMTDDESALSYEHYKFYNELKKGNTLEYVKGVCPPIANKINKPITSPEYYSNLYDDLENSDFTKLIHESKLDVTKASNPNDLNEQIEKSTKIQGKQLKGYNYLGYTRLDKYNKVVG